MVFVVGTLPDLIVEMLCTLEEKFKAMEVHSTSGLDVMDICLVSGLVIPKKFKVLEFDKYKGVICLCTHLATYCCKMMTYTNDDKLLIHYFQDSLIEASLE